MGRLLIVIGLVTALAGAAIAYGVPLGRLPGDFTFRRGHFTIYFPLATSLLASVVLMLVAALVAFLSKR